MSKKIMGSGAGDSRRFMAPEGTYAESPILDCHLNGIKVRDLNLTPEQLTQIPYERTDEGFAEKNKGKAPRISVSDPIDNVAGKLRDGYSAGMEAWEVPDARRELMDQHVPEGFRGRWLSEGKIKEQGMRGFVPVKESGEPVRLGTMILGAMPEERAQQRTEYFKALGRDKQRQAHDEVREQQERMASASGGGLKPLSGDRYNGVPQQDSFSVEAERESRREAGAVEFALQD